MVSATVWVPLVTAAVGLFAGLGTSILTQRRADSREDARWQQERQQTYARFLSALYELDARLNRALSRRTLDELSNKRTPLDVEGIDRARTAAREQLPLVQFMAPKETRDLAKSAVDRHETFLFFHLRADVADVHELYGEWAKVQDGVFSLLKAMRNDLGLEIAIEGAEIAVGSDAAAQPEISLSKGEGTPELPEGS